MANQRPNTSVHIAVNVMRARLTVLGFNIAIVSFQLAHLSSLSGGINVPGIEGNIHAAPSMALFLGLALSLLALVLYIMSCDFGEVGHCTHWSMILADIFMYVGLAQTVTGFFEPFIDAISNLGELLPAFAHHAVALRLPLVVLSGVVWFVSMYGGPLVSLVRSPFSRSVNFRLSICYLVLLVFTAYAHSVANKADNFNQPSADTGIFSLLKEFYQPFWW
jgi:hypothetical protein